MPNNIIDKIQLSGVTYDIGGGGGTVSSAITSGDTNAVAGGAVYDRFDEVEQVTAQALNVLNESLSGKQDTLSAGTNITIVDNVISAEGGSITIDPSLDTGSTNAVANSAITTALNNKQIYNSSGYFYDVTTSYQNSGGKYTDYIRFKAYKNNGSTTNVTKLYFPRINGNKLVNLGAYYTDFQLLEKSAVTSAITSSSTDAQVPSAKAVYDAIQEGGGGEVSSAITSGDTNAVAGGAVYDRFDEVEQVTAQALNVLNDRLDEDEEVTAAALNTLNEALSGKQDTLIAGENITISGNVISATGGGGISSAECQTMIDSSISGKTDTSAFTAYTAATNTALNSKLATSAVTSTITAGDTNPVQGGTLYNELRISNGGETETTLTFNGYNSTNYPEGCTKLKVEVVGSSNWSTIDFYNDSQNLGNVTIQNWGSISVTNSFDGATTEISGTTVIISYPTVTNVTKISVSSNGNHVYKAVTTEPPTVLKNQVVANTNALGGLSLVKLTQTEYDNLQTKDNSTLYVIVG